MPPRTKSPAHSPAKQLARFIAKFDPKNARFIRSVRSALRRRFPTAFELVYDNYNFFVIGFASTDRASDAFVSLVADGHGVSICFIYGARLPDPAGILRGGGNQTRSVRLQSAATLDQPEVQALLRAAVAHGKHPLPTTGRGPLIIKSVSAKQRPRRLSPN
jgi:Domain of unknown function (DU1801)